MESQTLLYGGVVVNNSIINPALSDKETQDKNEPFSFFDFLKHSDSSATPQQFNNAYQRYLTIWYEFKGQVGAANRASVRDQYISLLKDIALNYTTQNERRFLANIDFDNESDLAIVIPFYSRKIKEICDFFISKREDVKQQAQRVKIKGTAKSFEKFIFDVVIDFLFADDSDSSYRTTNVALTSIASNLDIEIEDLFDTYGEYFDLDPQADKSLYDVKNEVRAKYFPANTNSIDSDLFLDFDEQLKQEIFNVPVFLRQLGPKLSINIDTSLIDLECDPNNPFAELLKRKKEPSTEKLRLQQRLIEKYIGTDFYYLSTGSTATSIASGVLFEAENPSGNLVNRRFPSTASVPEDQLNSARRLGLFFKPDRLGLLYYYSPAQEFRINRDLLEPDKIYIFPDPNKYGNISPVGQQKYTHPLLFTIDIRSNIKNRSMQYAFGDIYKDPRSQAFYGYYSRVYDIDTETINVSALNNNFNGLYNKGIITEWKTDIWGNQYGLFKDRYGAKKVIEDIANTQIKCLVFDGHQFYDQDEGYGFNYETDQGLAFNGALRTGLTAKTVDNIPPSGGNFLSGYGPFYLSAGMIFLSGNPTYLYFREFTPYEECPDSGRAVNCVFYDGARFTFLDGTALPDPISTDSSIWPGAGAYYYNILIEGGVSSLVPLQRATTDGNDGDFTLNTTYQLSAVNVTLFDGGFFTDTCELTNDYPYSEKTPFYVDTVSGTSLVSTATAERSFQSIADTRALTGQLFFKDVVSNQVKPASAALTKLFRKYPAPIRDELNTDIRDMDLVYDTIVLTTSSYFVIDQIVYEDEEVIDPGTINTFQALTSVREFDKISNPFFVEGDRAIYYAKTRLLPALSATNAKTIYFEFYRYSIQTHTNKKLFPTNSTSTSNLTALFQIFDTTSEAALSTNMVRINTPRLTYNSRNNKFALTYVAEDNNNTPYIFTHVFSYNGEAVEFNSNLLFKPDTISFTHNFSTVSGSWADIDSALDGAPDWNVVEGVFEFSC